MPRRPVNASRVKALPGDDLTERERRFLALIRDEGPVTRAGLIRASGLSGPAVFRATEDLAAKGYVTIGPTIASGRGQPSNEVRLNAEAAFTLGLSITDDFAEAILLDLEGRVRAVANVTAPGMRRADILDRAQELVDRCGDFGLLRSALAGVGLAVAGFFIGDGAQLNPVAALDEWALIELGPDIETRFGAPAFIENIASATAVGESLIGHGTQINSFAYVNFAFGFGGGVILNGRLWRGVHGNAGEFAAVLNAFDAFVPSLESLRADVAASGVECPSITHLIANFDPDWPAVDAWRRKASRSLTRLAQAIHAIVDINALVLGGRAPPALLDRLRRDIGSVGDTSTPVRRGRGRPPIQVLAAKVSDRAAAIGAAALPMSQRLFTPLSTS